MRIIKLITAILVVSMLLGACGTKTGQTPTGSTESLGQDTSASVSENIVTKQVGESATTIRLADNDITVNGKAVSTDSNADVYIGNDIVFYLEGQPFTYGEGDKDDAHSQTEADAHTVVHITKPGEYIVSGTLSAGQIAIDLGEDAKKDPNAVVTLMLDGVDITCSVAPAVIFYNVYECGTAEEETATMTVDTSSAGANVILADDSMNKVNGSYVARIYQSVELSEDGTEILDSKKLHKYDGAFYSKMSMNIYGESIGNGILNINAENEGLDSELHLTQYSGNIHIQSGNDGINTNEDNVSVANFKGGSLTIVVTGTTGEGDGIDSNGWLIIDGCKVTASACGFSSDAGIDADKGVYIQSGQVIASGNMLDHVQGEQTHATFTFSKWQTGGKAYTLKDEAGNAVLTCTPANDFQYLVVSAPNLTAGNYTFWKEDIQLSGAKVGMGMGGGMPGGMQGGEQPEMPEGMNPPEGNPFEGMEKPNDTPMEGIENPDREPPAGIEPPDGGNEQRPGGMGGFPNGNMGQGAEVSQIFEISNGSNAFQIVE